MSLNTFNLLSDDQRTLVEAALNERTRVAYFNHRGSGSASQLFDLPKACQNYVEEALTEEECDWASVHNIKDEWFVIAARRRFLFLVGIPAPEKNATLVAAAMPQTKPFKITEFFTTSDGLGNLFSFVVTSGIGAFFLLGPLGHILLSPQFSTATSMLPARILYFAQLMICAGASLYFLLDLPVKRHHWRRKTTAAFGRLRSAIW